MCFFFPSCKFPSYYQKDNYNKDLEVIYLIVLVSIHKDRITSHMLASALYIAGAHEH